MLAWRWGRPGDRPGDRAPPALCSGQHRASSDTGGSGDGASTPRAGNTRRAARAPRPVQAAPRAQLGRTRPAPSPRALHPVRAAPRYDQRVTHEPVARLRSRCPRFAPAVRKDARSEQPLAHGRQRGRGAALLPGAQQALACGDARDNGCLFVADRAVEGARQLQLGLHAQ